MIHHTLTLLRITYKKLKEKLTVSDSKKLFHEKFPFVIPGIYKRIVDEMLVELNLLNHQNEFNQDSFFCYGITETFKELTKGYKPEDHLDILFDSLCSATNFDSNKIKQIHENFKTEIKDKGLEDISNLLKQKSNSNFYPSRILNLGVYLIISSANDFKKIKDSEKTKIISDSFKSLNLSTAKAEKDIGIYESSIKKLAQAKELLEEIKLKDKKK